MRLLDLFCGAGGAGMGYRRAGFEVVGVDLRPQPHYPFTFIQADALQYLADHGHEFDAIHASPPCQAYSVMRRGRWQDRAHPELIAPVRQLLIASGKPYVIENVAGARSELIAPVMLCGTMFGLQSGGYALRRHRLFEVSGRLLLSPATCNHTAQALPVYGHAGGTSKRDGLRFPATAAWREGMGIDWMSGKELSEAIPPAYTQWIGQHLLAANTRS